MGSGSSLLCKAIGEGETASSCAKGRFRYWEKLLHRKGGQTLEQVALGSGGEDFYCRKQSCPLNFQMEKGRISYSTANYINIQLLLSLLLIRARNEQYNSTVTNVQQTRIPINIVRIHPVYQGTYTVCSFLLIFF